MLGRTDGAASASILLVADAEDLAGDLATWLGERYRVDVVVDNEMALRTLDTTIDIVLVARESPDGSSGDLVAAIQMRGLDCGVVLVTAMDPPGDGVTPGIDALLVTPIDCAEVRYTVFQVHQLVQYDRLLTAFFEIASKKARLETHVPPAELEQMAEYETLLARSDALKRKLASLTSTFTPSQFEALWNRSAVANPHELPKPATE